MSKRTIQPVEDDQVRLRLLEENDLPLTLAWRNQDEIRKWFFHSQILSFSQHHAWFDQYQSKDNDFVFIIEDVTRERLPVGQVAIYNIDWQKRAGEFGRLMIGDMNVSGRGFAQSATRLILSIACSQLALETVYLEVFANNARAIAVYKKCGFQVTCQDDQVIRMSYITGETLGI